MAITMQDISGGDTVRLYTGEIKEVYDIHHDYIESSGGVWHHINEVKEIVEKFRNKKKGLL